MFARLIAPSDVRAWLGHSPLAFVTVDHRHEGRRLLREVVAGLRGLEADAAGVVAWSDEGPAGVVRSAAAGEDEVLPAGEALALLADVAAEYGLEV